MEEEKKSNGVSPIKTRPPPAQQEGKREDDKDDGEDEVEVAPPLMALNHVSRLCRSVEKSIEFYVGVLGFVEIKRPPTLKFEGAWLFNYGVGIHLVQSKKEDRLPDATEDLDPMDNHISFQCADIKAMEEKLKDMNIKYMKRTVKGDEEGKSSIDQLFFKDPDGFMIEICNCENLKLQPANSCGGRIRLPYDRHNPPLNLDHEDDKDNAADANQ